MGLNFKECGEQRFSLSIKKKEKKNTTLIHQTDKSLDGF